MAKKAVILFSGGKDSVFAIYSAQKQGYEVTCLITLESENKYSWMFHTPNIFLTKKQAECLDLPLLTYQTKGIKEKELIDLENAIKSAKEEYDFDTVFTGALWSDYQASRITKICKKLELKIENPAWHKNQEQYMKELIDLDFKFIFSAVAADSMDKDWVGKFVTNESLNKLIELNKNIGLNVAGEGGEFESTVLDAPIFKKKIVINNSEIIDLGKNEARLIIKDVELIEK